MYKLFLTVSLFGLIAGNAQASNDEVSFRFEDGFTTALLFFSGDENSAAAKMYERMEYVNAIDEGIGMAKSWHEQLFQWKCIAKTSGDYACKAKFYNSHPGTEFDVNGGTMTFEGGVEFAQTFIRDQSGFGIGVRSVAGSQLKTIVHRGSFELTASE